jgi:hypothetical protein
MDCIIRKVNEISINILPYSSLYSIIPPGSTLYHVKILITVYTMSQLPIYLLIYCAAYPVCPTTGLSHRHVCQNTKAPASAYQHPTPTSSLPYWPHQVIYPYPPTQLLLLDCLTLNVTAL